MMNPETNRFEPAANDEDLLRAYARGWKVFAIGEKVTIKDTDFSVVDISPTKLVLRPYGQINLQAGQAEEKQHAR
jgi:hypothetical protein